MKEGSKCNWLEFKETKLKKKKKKTICTLLPSSELKENKIFLHSRMNYM